MSPLGLFMQAGPVGKGVIILLILISLWCWALIVEAWWSSRRLRGAVAQARAGGDPGLLARVLAVGEASVAEEAPGESVSETRGRVAEAMHRAGADLVAVVERGMPSLAIIASAAPFIGLFGTVWGIMTSFTGIAQSQDTSLAVVAPGIAEALAATAMGLAAAIPASVAYTRLNAGIARVAQGLGHFIDERAAALTLQRARARAAQGV